MTFCVVVELIRGGAAACAVIYIIPKSVKSVSVISYCGLMLNYL